MARAWRRAKHFCKITEPSCHGIVIKHVVRITAQPTISTSAMTNTDINAAPKRKKKKIS
jgi:hypothetical protein